MYELLSQEYGGQELDEQKLAVFRDELKNFVLRPHEPRYPHFLFTLRDSGPTRPIGSASLRPHGDDVELGYWIARPFRKLGLGEEAITAILNHARSLGHKQITAWHFNENEASGKLLQKCGFTPTGKKIERYNGRLKFLAPADLYAADLTVNPAGALSQPAAEVPIAS